MCVCAWDMHTLSLSSSGLWHMLILHNAGSSSMWCNLTAGLRGRGGGGQCCFVVERMILHLVSALTQYRLLEICVRHVGN